MSTIKDCLDIELFKKYLERKGLSEGTVVSYTKSVERFLITKPDLNELESYNDFIIKYAIKKRCSHYASALKEFINFKITDNKIKKPLLNNIIKPKRHKGIIMKRKHLEYEDLQRVINCLQEPKHKIMALIQSATGARIGDILSLKEGSIIPEFYDKKYSILKLSMVGKGGRGYDVVIHDEDIFFQLIDYMKYAVDSEPRKFENYYFINIGTIKGRKGQIDNLYLMKKMNYEWYWRDLKTALNTAGIDRRLFSTHDFRRCFARRFWMKHKDVHALKNILHHQDASTTLRYLNQSGLENSEYYREMQEDKT